MVKKCMKSPPKELSKKARNRSYIKMGNYFFKCHEYKDGDRCLLCMGEKLVISFYNNSDELLYQRPEI